MQPTDKKKNLKNWQNFMKLDSLSTKMMINLVKHPVITERSSKVLITKNQYTFDVDIRLNKPQIKRLFFDLFEVKIFAINTHRLPRKRKTLGRTTGSKPKYKRAILTLEKGQSISLKQVFSLK